MADSRKEQWAARYEEGYVDLEGSWITIENRLVANHGWDSPDAAVRAWGKRGDFGTHGVTRYLNGKQQVDDVRNRQGFKNLPVTQVWRRITFERRSRE